MNLREKVISGVIWSTIERFSVQGIRFLVTLVLARILSPGDYGLIGMLTIFTAVSNVFIDSGFGHTLIQKKDSSETDYSTIFYYSITLAVIFYFVLFFSAPAIAGFYDQPQLKSLSRVVFLNIIITTLSGMQNVVIIRNLNFRIYARITVISYSVSGVVSISLAIMGFGVWSLVLQSLLNSAIQTSLLWFYNSWRPLLVFSIDSFKKLFAKSSSLLATGIITQVFENIYYVIIGKYYSNVNLGYYTQARRLQEMPLMTLNGVIQAVTFPALSRIQDDDDRLRASYSKIIQIFMFINIPLMLGLMICARPLVLSVLTEKWLPILPYLYLFCITGIFYPLGLINGNTLKVKGKFRLMFQIDLVKKAVLLALLALSFKYGLYAIVAGQAVYLLVGIMVNMFFGSRLISFSIRQQIRLVLPYLAVAVISIIPGLLLLSLKDTNPVIILVSEILAISVFYIILSRFFKLYAFTEILSIMREKIRMKNKTA